MNRRTFLKATAGCAVAATAAPLAARGVPVAFYDPQCLTPFAMAAHQARLDRIFDDAFKQLEKYDDEILYGHYVDPERA